MNAENKIYTQKGLIFMESKRVTFIRKGEKIPSGRVNNILKLFFLLLKGEEGSLEYYAGKIGCEPRTVKKYISELRMAYDPEEGAGIDIQYNRGNKSYSLITKKWSIPVLKPDEAEALYMAVRYLAGQRGTPFKHLPELERKLRKCFPKDLEDRFKKGIVVAGPETESKLGDLLGVIDEAVIDKRKLVMDYTPTYHKDPVKREVVPFSLLSHDYEWYIRAFCLKDKKFKTYSVNQIVSVKTEKLREKERKLLPKKSEDSYEHMWDWASDESGEPVDVRVKFTGQMMERMKKKLRYRKEHPSQKIEEFEDSVIVSFTVKNLFNMMPWLLQFGSLVEVLEPEGLRERMWEEGERVMRVYV